MTLQLQGTPNLTKPLTITSSGSVVVLGRYSLSFIASAFSGSTNHRGQTSLTVSGSFSSSGDKKLDQEFFFTKSRGNSISLSEKEDTVEHSYCVTEFFEDKEREKIKKLVRQGAPFCCLKLFSVKGPKIPPNLPLSKRLAASTITPEDPNSLLSHFNSPKKWTTL